MKDKYEGCYIDGYKDHYAVFADNGEKLAEYDTHKEAKEDIAEWEAEVKNESYIPADTLATGYRFTIHETELLENAIKKHVEQKVDQGVNAMFDTDSEEFKKVGNEPYDKSQWWDDMKLTMRIKKTPFPRKNGYTNGDFRPNQKWLMGAIECCKSARDCEYLLKDAYLSVAHDKKLIQNLKSVRDGNPDKYVNVKVVQKWLDNGVTPEKVEKHIEWFKANYIKGLQAKKKEFNKAQNETATEEPMNEGAVGIGSIVFCSIFLGAAIFGKAKTALDKHKKKSELKTGKNAYKLPYDKFDQIYRSMTNLIKDIKRLQKESKYYNLIYNYNEIKEDISNTKSGVNIREVYKKGSPVQLYGMVEYYSAENIERYKNLLASMPDPKKNWYDSENEDYIQDIEQKVYDEFDKHLDILGFSEDKSESYKLKSSKYPGIYIHMTINGDGAYFTIYPDYPKNVFILGDESENDLNSKSKKKLNEDHSEISNDPEMEELMALAGVTTADLDDLENDNDLDLDEDDPIDANTLREIDAAMDESVKSAINNIELATKGMDVNIEQIEKFIPVAKNFMKYVKSAPIAYDENTGDGLKIKNDTVDFINRCLKFDYDRGSDDELKIIGRNWIKYNLATLFDKLSFNNKKVSPAQLELYKKCVKGGEFDKRLQKCYNELKAILKELNDFYDQLAKKLGSDFEKTVNYKMLNSFGNEYNYFWGQYCFTTGDKNATMKYAGRTRVSFFGKKIRDSINESVGGVIAISVAGLIGGAAIINAITERKLKAEAKELTKAEFDKLINDMVSINEAVISKLKTSKWWKFIYEPCMNRKNTPDIHNQASKYKQEFMSGKCIGPSFYSSFVDIDDPDPKIYTKLDAEIGRSPDDEAWEKAFDSAYYESQKLIKEAVKKLGFNDEGRSTKYPDIKIDIGSGEYIGIWIEPIYNGYYKLKDTKKSQNESVNTDLDILLAESAEFLSDE